MTPLAPTVTEGNPSRHQGNTSSTTQKTTPTSREDDILQSEEMSSAIQAAKQKIRLSIRKTLTSLDQGNLQAQADSVTRKVLQHPSYTSAKRLSVYISMPNSELRTDAIIHDALSQDKKVFIPYIPKNSRNSKMEMLLLRDLEDFQNLIPNKWKIREFTSSKEEEDPDMVLKERENALNEDTKEGLDLILMPGLAFDRQLNRLGHGRGYYDTYLHRCALFSQQNGLNRPSTIALALNEQILNEDQSIPALTVEDGHSSGHRDIKPDMIIYPNGQLTLDDL